MYTHATPSKFGGVLYPHLSKHAQQWESACRNCRAYKFFFRLLRSTLSGHEFRKTRSG